MLNNQETTLQYTGIIFPFRTQTEFETVIYRSHQILLSKNYYKLFYEKN